MKSAALRTNWCYIIERWCSGGRGRGDTEVCDGYSPEMEAAGKVSGVETTNKDGCEAQASALYAETRP